jgi:hypothetical protein
MAEKIYVQVNDADATCDLVIGQSAELGADRLNPGRHGVRFFDYQPGHYLPDQISDNLEKIRGVNAARLAINKLIASSNEAEISESARQGLRTLLGHLGLAKLDEQ